MCTKDKQCCSSRVQTLKENQRIKQSKSGKCIILVNIEGEERLYYPAEIYPCRDAAVEAIRKIIENGTSGPWLVEYKIAELLIE